MGCGRVLLDQLVQQLVRSVLQVDQQAGGTQGRIQVNQRSAAAGCALEHGVQLVAVDHQTAQLLQAPAQQLQPALSPLAQRRLRARPHPRAPDETLHQAAAVGRQIAAGARLLEHPEEEGQAGQRTQPIVGVNLVP